MLQDVKRNRGGAMAAIKCEDCGKMISDKADLCPYCKFPVGGRTIQPIKQKRRPLRFGLVTIAALCALSFFTGMVSMQILTHPVEEKKPQERANPVKVAKKTKPVEARPQRMDWREREDPTMAYLMMEDFVKKRLKAPKTAEFPSVWSGRQDHVTYLGSQRYRIVSYVDAQNSFGALIRNNFVGEVEQISEDRWSLISFEFVKN